jgi:hypothetical protein
MKNLITLTQKNKIKELIETELLKRGFTTKLIEFKEVGERTEGHFIELWSKPFQTIPVLFKEVRIANFSTSVKEGTIISNNKAIIPIIRVWIQVCASYISFSGGNNSVSLFEFRCICFGKEEINDVKIR